MKRLGVWLIILVLITSCESGSDSRSNLVQADSDNGMAHAIFSDLVVAPVIRGKQPLQISFHTTSDEIRNFCLERQGEEKHRVVLGDIGSETSIELTTEVPCATLPLHSYKVYQIQLSHDGVSPDQVFFIREKSLFVRGTANATTTIQANGCPGCDLSGVTISTDLQSPNFSSTDLSNATFSGTYYNGNFTNADLSSVTFQQAQFIGGDFTGANFSSAQFSADSDIDNATLANSNFNSSDIENLSLSNMQGAIIDGHICNAFLSSDCITSLPEATPVPTPVSEQDRAAQLIAEFGNVLNVSLSSAQEATFEQSIAAYCENRNARPESPELASNNANLFVDDILLLIGADASASQRRVLVKAVIEFQC